MPYRVQLTSQAESDLRDIFRYIAGQASQEVARSYVNRIFGSIGGLEMFPERGTLRNDVRPGLRVIGFERRVSIAFVIEGESVAIM